MPSNTIYLPADLNLDSSRIQGAGRGVLNAACVVGDVTNLDLLITDDMIITGLVLKTKSALLGDYVVLQAVVGGNVVGLPVPGPWYVSEDGSDDFNFVIPTKIPAGITLRAIYHSTADVLATSPGVAVNYKLWKVLV